MFVGEAPGADENAQLRPFVGNAGGKLNQLFFDSNIKRMDVYLTNILKCHPPNNRDPEHFERQNCLQYLRAEIEMLKPKLIIALGVVASQVLTGKGMKWRGMIVPCILPGLENYNVLITYHPSFLFHMRTEYSTVLHDLTKILYPNPTYPELYEANPTPERIRHLFYEKWKGKVKTTDIETWGEVKEDALNPWKGKIIGISFSGSPGEAFSLDLNGMTFERWAVVKELLESGEPICLQNNTFDICYLLLQQGIRIKNLNWDTMDAMHVIYSDTTKNLDKLRSLYTTIPPYKHVYQDKQGQVSHLPKEQLSKYSCYDADSTYRVMEAQKQIITGKPLEILNLILEYDKVAVDMRIRGIPTDENALLYNTSKLVPLADELEERWWKDHQVNLRSPKQVGSFLFDKLELPPPAGARNKTGWSSKDIILKQLARNIVLEKEQKLIKEIQQHRKLALHFGTFVKGVYDRRDAKGFLHPNWIPTGTDTGRWACQDPNMQNIPKHLRNFVMAELGKIFYIGDYKQLELLVGAILTESTELVDFLLGGGDVHAMVKDEINKVSKASRTEAKAVGFGTIYGLSPTTIAKEYNIEYSLAYQWQEVVKKMFPKVFPWHEKNIAFWEKHQYVETFFGRKKYCETELEVRNAVIQGTAFDVAGKALVALNDNGWNPIWNVHDENCAYLTDEEASKRSLTEFQTVMETAAPELLHRFPVEVEKKTRWKEYEWSDDAKEIYA